MDDVNKYLKNNLKKIFSIAAKETIIQINSELKGGNVDMWRKIKVIIADDNVHFCKFIREYLEKYNDIEILGVANSDEDEIKMIEELKPEIVITDLMRNHRYTGLDIIKRYNDDNSKIKFLVISADYKKDVITDGLEVAGYIKKPFNDYKVIYDELKRIKKGINESEYKEWLEKYHNLEVRDINDKWNDGVKIAKKLRAAGFTSYGTGTTGWDKALDGTTRANYKIIFNSEEFISSKMNLDSAKKDMEKLRDGLLQVQSGGTFTFGGVTYSSANVADLSDKYNSQSGVVSGLETVHNSLRKQYANDAATEDKFKFVKNNQANPAEPSHNHRTEGI